MLVSRCPKGPDCIVCLDFTCALSAVFLAPIPSRRARALAALRRLFRRDRLRGWTEVGFTTDSSE